MIYLVKCLPYLKDSEAGFDLLTFTNNADGSVTMEPVTRTGFGDRYSHGFSLGAGSGLTAVFLVRHSWLP